MGTVGRSLVWYGDPPAALLPLLCPLFGRGSRGVMSESSYGAVGLGESILLDYSRPAAQT
jgi:hypothetical protein